MISSHKIAEVLALFDKKVINKGKWPEFILHVLMVVERLRDSYLVDNLFISPDTAYDLIVKIEDILSIRGDLMVLSIGDQGEDVIITRRDTFRGKFRHLQTITSPEEHTSLFIDLQGFPLQILEDTESALVRSCLERAAVSAAINAAPVLDGPVRIPMSSDTVCDEFKRIVGYPLLAGWLLGYPFIYRSVQEQDTISNDTGGPNENPSALSSGAALSMTVLRKISVIGNIESFSEFSKMRGFPMKGEDKNKTISIMEFTMPVQLIEEGTAAANFLQQWIANRKVYFSQLLERHSSGINSTGREADSIFLVDSIRFDVTDVTSTSLIL